MIILQTSLWIKMIKAHNIELFKDLTSHFFDDIDLHNDFDCVEILFNHHILSLLFKQDSKKVALRFFEVDIEKMNLFSPLKNKCLAVDMLYRGRFVTK